MRALALLVVFAACSDFETIDRNVCGNGLLEAGEDCDNSSASCVSCALICTVDADCPTSDFHCGTDGLCHAPGGALGKPQIVGGFEVNDYRVSDVDHDGNGDVLGVSRSSIVVRYGDAAAPLSRVESTVTPSQNGPPAFGDLDLDGAADVSISTLDGLVSYTSRYGRISGVAVQSAVTNSSANVRHFVTIGPNLVGIFLEADNKLAIGIVDFTDEAAQLTPPNPCGQTVPIADFSPDNVDVYRLGKPGDITTDAVISMVTGTGMNKRLCVLSVHKTTVLNTAEVHDITPINLGLARKPILADLTGDGDPCPSLINSDAGLTNLRKWDGVQQSGGWCAFTVGANSMPALAGPAPDTALVGHVPFELVAIAPDALVLASGVWAYSPGFGTYGELYHSTRTIKQAEHGDVDGDGDIDGVLRGVGDDIDVLLKNGVFFQQLLVDTAAQPDLIALDDFDGNDRIDIGFTEPVGDNKRLMIAYGTPDLPLPPIEVHRFDDVLSVACVRFGSSTDYFATIADMVVLLPDNRVTVLSGSTQRTMLSFFDPRASKDVKDTTLFRSTVIGNFASPTDFPDVVGLAALREGVTAGSTPTTGPVRVGVRAWSVRGTDAGLDGTTSDGVQVDGADDCSVSGGSGLCIDDASYIPWSVTENHDVVIAIDREKQAAVFDPSSASALKLTPTAVTLPIPTGSVVRSIHAADIDGDGAKELVASFAPRGQPASAVLVCEVDGSGVPSGCVDLVPDIMAAEPATTACFDAAPGRFGYRTVTAEPTAFEDLVVLCHDTGSTLHRVYRDADGLHVEPIARVRNVLTSIEIGDVTGDLVDDVIGIEGEAGARSLVVFPQCTNRDSTCVNAGVSP